ncbi:hypothetical protein LINPERPRIM_LOCUS17494 [Linum perenne]
MVTVSYGHPLFRPSADVELPTRLPHHLKSTSAPIYPKPNPIHPIRNSNQFSNRTQSSITLLLHHTPPVSFFPPPPPYLSTPNVQKHIHFASGSPLLPSRRNASLFLSSTALVEIVVLDPVSLDRGVREQ